MNTEKNTSPPSAQGNRRTRSDGRETAEKILEFADREILEHGLVNFNLDRVIEKSGVSRSSVYHHFGGREGVITAAETRALVNELYDGFKEMDKVLSTVSTGDEAFKLIELGLLMSGSHDQKMTRERRISTLAMSRTIHVARETLGRRQAEGTREFAAVIRSLRDRGLFDPIEPIEGIAHLIQSMLLGRILVDILEDPAEEEAWLRSSTVTLRLLLRPR